MGSSLLSHPYRRHYNNGLLLERIKEGGERIINICWEGNHLIPRWALGELGNCNDAYSPLGQDGWAKGKARASNIGIYTS